MKNNKVEGGPQVLNRSAPAAKLVFEEPEPVYVESLDTPAVAASWLLDEQAWVAARMAAALQAPTGPQPPEPAEVAAAKADAPNVEAVPEKRMKQTVLTVVNENLTVGRYRQVTILGQMRATITDWCQHSVVPAARSATVLGRRGLGYVADNLWARWASLTSWRKG